MKNYVRPMIVTNAELGESVYMGSGNCYVFDARIVQSPEFGRDYYVIQIDGEHTAAATHHSTQRTVVINFNQPVNYKNSGASDVSGSGTNTLYLTYTDGCGGAYHNNNGRENIGLGNLEVTSAPGLAIQATYCNYCNETCAQHDGK